MSFRLLTQPLALGGVVATDVATVGELDGDVVEGAGEGEWRRVPGRHSRSVVLADADEVCDGVDNNCDDTATSSTEYFN